MRELRTRERALALRRRGVGFLLLAGAILLCVLWRAPAAWVFPAGWWRF